MDNISSDDPDEFATKLFRRWGIGKKDNNNGVLILVVVQQRKVVIRTGYGAEGVLPDIIAGRIVTHKMIPLFEEEDYDRGLWMGVLWICEQICNPEARAELRSAQEEYQDKGLTFERSYREKLTDNETHSLFSKKMDIFNIYLLISCVVAVFMLLLLLIVLLCYGNRTEHEKYLHLRGFSIPYWALTVLFMLIPIPAALILTYLLRRWRNHPRNCPSCGTQMKKLGEKEDNLHLNKAQDKEEKIDQLTMTYGFVPIVGRRKSTTSLKILNI